MVFLRIFNPLHIPDLLRGPPRRLSLRPVLVARQHLGILSIPNNLLLPVILMHWIVPWPRPLPLILMTRWASHLRPPPPLDQGVWF